MANSPNEKKPEQSPVVVTIARPLSGSHEAWQLYTAAKALLNEVENCRQKITDLEKIINGS